MSAPMNDSDIAAELDALWPEWRDLEVGEQRTVGSTVVERTRTGWSTWQPSLRSYNEPREIGGYSEDTGWSLSDYGLLGEIERERRR